MSEMTGLEKESYYRHCATAQIFLALYLSRLAFQLSFSLFPRTQLLKKTPKNL